MLQGKPAAALVVLLLAVALAGCASGPKYSKIKNSIPELNPEQGRIYFYHTVSSINLYYPSIVLDPAFVVVLDPAVVGKMVPGFFYVDRIPGTYWALGGKHKNVTALRFTLDANQTLYVRSNVSYVLSLIGNLDRYYFELVDAEKALVEMQDLGYTGTEALNTKPSPGAR